MGHTDACPSLFPGWLLVVLISGILAGCGAAAQATSTPTAPQPTGTATPKPCIGSSAVLGGPVAAFVACYGASGSLTATSYTAPIDANESAVLLLALQQGCVTNVGLTAVNATWTAQQTFTACTPFLPVGATPDPGSPPLNPTGGTTLHYHSALGEVVMQVAAGVCNLSLAST